MLAITRCSLAWAMVAVAKPCCKPNAVASVGGPPNKREKSASLLPIQRMAVVGFSAAASSSSVGPGYVQGGFRISAAITSIGFVQSGGHDDGSPTSAPTVNPGTATSRVCRVFSRVTGVRVVTTAYEFGTIEIWGYPGAGKRGRCSETCAWVAITLA